MPSQPRKRILFYRDYQGFQGGHLKVWDYFQHVLASPNYQPIIHFSSNSRWDTSNPWFDCDVNLLASEWDPKQADAIFAAGLDWQIIPPYLSLPIINLIQGVRHADNGDPRKEFLQRRAIRICVSDEIRQAIVATGLVNGPIVTIPNGVKIQSSCHPATMKNNKKEILLAGMKNPTLAHRLAIELGNRGHSVTLQIDKLPRNEFLAKLEAARIAILLPQGKEGFFLPALEAMALQCLVVCPDCIGNRSFCIDRINSFRPDYCFEAILKSALHAIRLHEANAKAILKCALHTVEQHSLANERSAFQKILDKI